VSSSGQRGLSSSIRWWVAHGPPGSGSRTEPSLGQAGSVAQPRRKCACRTRGSCSPWSSADSPGSDSTCATRICGPSCPFARSGSIPGIGLSSRVATIPPPGRPGLGRLTRGIARPTIPLFAPIAASVESLPQTLPAGPQAGQQDPEQAVGRSQPWTRHGALEDDQLVPQREVLEHEGAHDPGTPRHARDERVGHGDGTPIAALAGNHQTKGRRR
jgi:hypothetical protein